MLMEYPHPQTLQIKIQDATPWILASLKPLQAWLADRFCENLAGYFLCAVEDTSEDLGYTAVLQKEFSFDSKKVTVAK